MSVLVAMEIPLSLCPAANKNTLEMVQYGVEGSSTFLECQARSPHAVIKWHLQRDNSDRRKEVSCHSPCFSKMLLTLPKHTSPPPLLNFLMSRIGSNFPLTMSISTDEREKCPYGGGSHSTTTVFHFVLFLRCHGETCLFVFYMQSDTSEK